MSTENVEIKKLKQYEIPPPNKEVSEYKEAEKMQSNILYKPMDPELVNGRCFAKKKMQEFNTCDCLDFELRKKLLNELLGTSNEVFIEPPFYCDYGANIHFGEGCYLNHGCFFSDPAKIVIGARTLFAPFVQIYTATHPLDPIERRTAEYGRAIKIGSDW